MSSVLLASLSILGAGCGGSDDGSVCSTEARFGVGVTVRDATTHAALCVDGAVILRDGTYREELLLRPVTLEDGAASCAYSGALERAGTYAVSASVAGHAEHTQIVAVQRDQCHVQPVALVLELPPK
jgi:hypothetical protein